MKYARNWEPLGMKYKLSDICHYRKGKVDVSLLTDDTYISTENMIPNRGGITKASTLPTVDSTQLYKKGDILVSNIRPYFKKIWQATCDGGCSNDVLVFQANEGFDQDYLYYVLSDDAFFAYAMKTSKGTKMPRGDKHSIMQYETEVCDLATQRKIASLLKSIDSKIELNNAINNNLMQQAKTIFEAEIVNRSELPNGWKKSNLASIADYLNGLAMQNFRPNDDDQGLPVLKIKELRQGSCDADSERCSSYIKSNYIVNDGDVIFSWSGSLLVDFWCGGICGLNQHLFKVTSTQYAPWFFYSWTNYHLAKFAAIASAKATTMGHIKRSDIEAAEVIIPSPADYERIGALIQPLYDLCVALRLEDRKLAATRDSLLPRLLSGDIDISEAII